MKNTLKYLTMFMFLFLISFSTCFAIILWDGEKLEAVFPLVSDSQTYIKKHPEMIALPKSLDMIISVDYADGRKVAQYLGQGYATYKLSTPTREGYTFKGWLIGEETVPGGTNYTLPFHSGGMKFTANWNVANYSVTVGAGENGTVTPSGKQTLSAGSNLNVQFKANKGYVLDKIYLDGKEVPCTMLSRDGGTEGSYLLEKVSADHTIKVVFKETPFVPPVSEITNYTVNVYAGENGSVTPSGAQTVSAGSKLNVQFKANTGFVLDNITLDGKEVPYTTLSKDGGTSGSYVLEKVAANHTIKVTFKKNSLVEPVNENINYTVTINAGENGTVTPSGKQTIKAGSKLNIQFKANKGYILDKIYLDGKEVPYTMLSRDGGTEGSYLLEKVMANHTIKVTFKKTPFVPPVETPTSYTVEILCGENGVTALKGVQTVEPNSNLTVSFKGIPGYVLDKIYLDDDEVQPTTLSKDGGTNGTYVLEKISANHIIKISFKEGPYVAPTLPPTIYTITSTCGANGTVNPNGKYHAEEGDDLKVQFIANSGYAVDKITLDGKQVEPDTISKDGTTASYWLYEIDSNHKISGTFKVAPPTAIPFENNSAENHITEPGNGQTTSSEIIPPETTHINVAGNELLVSNWAYAEVEKADNKKLIPAKLQTTNLTNKISRLEFANVCVSLYEQLTNQKQQAQSYNPFVDTNDENVLIAYSLRIINGTSETTFEPDYLITREQMATMITRTIKRAGALKQTDTKVTFADSNEVSDYAKESVEYMASQKLINGVGENLFNPKGNATREQALAISVRVLDSIK